DKEIKYKSFKPVDLATVSREDLVGFLMESGAWTLIRQRPFHIVPDAADVPKGIFISTFDTAPLAPNLDFVVKGKGIAFQKGLDVLAKLTSGAVHLGLNANGDVAPSAIFTEATGVHKHWFQGKHPAGNVGIQIHHISPIAGNDKVWTLGVQEVITIGMLFLEGKYDASRIVAVTGAEINSSAYVSTYLGANVGDLVGTLEENVRVISGDVLSGKEKAKEEFLDFEADQITAIKEGNDYEMFGWLAPTAARPSVSQTFLSGLMDITYEANTNTHGEKRAFVVTGQYEKVLTMDIYPQHLMKAILVNDFEKMEGLGINELIEEDVALCEFACTSKQPLQQILRTGLEVMREQA
ncbi:MAG: NADH:ubiquinone reductase (Na(+)-transporting) subunit A, partial [Bacteroidota bacterium]